MVAPSALLGAVTSIGLALKLFVFKKLISNFIATLAIVVTSAFSAWSPLQTALSEYCGSDASFGDVFFHKGKTVLALAMFLAVPGNIAAIVMAVMGFNHLITYGVAVAAYAATFFGNLATIQKYVCDGKSLGFKVVDTLSLDSTVCKDLVVRVEGEE
jgi:hypothetical protein